MAAIDTSLFAFLEELKESNSREWFSEHKERYEKLKIQILPFYQQIEELLSESDNVNSFHAYRIYRDIRFSSDKTPYKTHFSASISRKTAALRGGYYIHLEPNNIFIACGFWNPNKEDLFRIRKEIELDHHEFEQVLNDKELQHHFGTLHGEQLKTAPKGFNKDHAAIRYLRFKQFLLIKKFEKHEAVSADFGFQVAAAFISARPFLDYMSNVLTTDLNGESIL